MKATMGSVMRSRLERESMSVRDVNGHKSCKPASLTFSTLDIFELEIGYVFTDPHMRLSFCSRDKRSAACQVGNFSRGVSETGLREPHTCNNDRLFKPLHEPV